jgi:uncharacterized repeat protein (TIGR03803 family)
MTSKAQDQRYLSLGRFTSPIRRRAATCALAFAVVLVAGAIATPSALAQTFTTLHSFDKTDGTSPYAALVQATDGNLYGTLVLGGANDDGAAFKISTGGTLANFYTFCSQSGCTDGTEPEAALLQVSNGNFYGAAAFGGAYDGGTVFTITPGGTLTTLYSFCAQSDCTDGQLPGSLVQGADGNFYGTTFEGGTNFKCIFGSNCGTVFKITPTGALTTLYNFCSLSNCTDGSFPVGKLVQAIDGNFYGTTNEGGANGISSGGYGTVFKITPSGTLTTLYSFCAKSGCTDGEYPSYGLIQAANGEFYGTTQLGGTDAVGTVFNISAAGKLVTLHNFDGKDGNSPASALIQATDGNFYGTTERGGANCGSLGCGTIFEITSNGTLTTLHSFDGTDGEIPLGTLTQDTNGDFYGTTELGGTSSDGTVFSLSVGLGPFVETQTTSGKVGATVNILGTDLAGATSVTFNGTSAVFTIESKSAIAATVPAGATSGTVEVTTPFGTLKSNVPFRVQP